MSGEFGRRDTAYEVQPLTSSSLGPSLILGCRYFSLYSKETVPAEQGLRCCPWLFVLGGNGLYVLQLSFHQSKKEKKKS